MDALCKHSSHPDMASARLPKELHVTTQGCKSQLCLQGHEQLRQVQPLVRLDGTEWKPQVILVLMKVGEGTHFICCVVEGVFV